MSERKKRTGDVICWAVIGPNGEVYSLPDSRAEARQDVTNRNLTWPEDGPHRIAKVVLAK